MHKTNNRVKRINFASGPKISVKVILEEGKIIESFLEISSSFSVEIHGDNPKKVICWLENYSHHKHSTDFEDILKVTPFTNAVLQVLKEIPFNEKLSYKEVAERVGTPKGARAVGQAVGANPIPLFIPCHRVIRSDGSIGGFSQGIKVKERLISFEKG